MRTIDEDGDTANTGILLFVFALIVVGCCLTAIADDTPMPSASEVVTLDVQNMT